MPRILVCQHVPFEILGTLNPALKQAGFRIRYVNFGRQPHARPDLDGYQGLVLLGGPMSAWDDRNHPHLPTEVELVREALAREMPVLGICLGAQLIARALGADVRRNKVPEIGWYPVTLTDEGGHDPLLAHCHRREYIFQWHGDTFEIPAGAVHLAASEGCANQAFRYGDACYGFQFHMEVDEPLIERWLRLPAMREELAAMRPVTDDARIRADTHRHIQRLHYLSAATFNRFVQLFGRRRRVRTLPSA